MQLNLGHGLVITCDRNNVFDYVSISESQLNYVCKRGLMFYMRCIYGYHKTDSRVSVTPGHTNSQGNVRLFSVQVIFSTTYCVI